MKKLWQLVIPIALVILTLVVYAIVTRDKETEPDIVKVEKGIFEVVITSMGELEALESMNITIPEALQSQNMRIRGMTITDIVKEGTVVKPGDYVATLNPAEVEEQLKTQMERLDLYEVDLDNIKIDTSLVLSEARDGIRQMRDQMMDKELKLEQSKYESKAVQRQAQISMEVAQRNMEQKQRNYITLKRKHEIRISRAQDRLNNQNDDIAALQQLKRDLRILAPGPGLVVYAKGNDDMKIRIGSQVNRWSPLVATLPDLSSLQSVAYVKEIDVSKVQPGLTVRIKIDAFPDSEFKGVIKRVANVGQEMQGQFLTGFKVEIKVDPSGKTLLPGMTCTNNIVVSSINDVLMIPRKAIHSYDEGLFVYKKDGFSIVKQQVETGGENDSYVWITKGLNEGERVYLHAPNNKEDAIVVKL